MKSVCHNPNSERFFIDKVFYFSAKYFASTKNISIHVISSYQTPILDSTGKLYFIPLLETMNNIGVHRKASNTRHLVKAQVWVNIWFKLCIKRFSFTIKLSNTIKFNYLKNYCCTLNSKILLPDWSLRQLIPCVKKVRCETQNLIMTL